ncbi:MAG TPA: transglutaminase domain-containing protein [Thermoleophilia bacterium]|nr:transglutaminase domain-containing protein [Thermoleophilia bacterium]
MRFPRWLLALIAVLFAFFVLYPNPLVLVRSIEHVRHPKVDPQAAASIARTLPNDPRLIEQAVLTRIVPYAYDWQTAGVPWYFPTTREALAQHRGDCESRAVVLASILAYKHIPYQLRMSFDHIWVQYPGHVNTALENPGVQLAVREHGHYVFHWPKDFHLGAEVNAQLADYWTPMPDGRKALLFGGLAAILLANVLIGLGRRSVGGARRLATGRSDSARPETGRS